MSFPPFPILCSSLYVLNECLKYLALSPILPQSRIYSCCMGKSAIASKPACQRWTLMHYHNSTVAFSFIWSDLGSFVVCFVWRLSHTGRSAGSSLWELFEAWSSAPRSTAYMYFSTVWFSLWPTVYFHFSTFCLHHLWRFFIRTLFQIAFEIFCAMETLFCINIEGPNNFKLKSVPTQRRGVTKKKPDWCQKKFITTF